MLTRMTDEDWATVLEVFRACRSRRGGKGRNDRTFLEALHFFSVHNITWRALPETFGNWNSIWKRFWRLSRAGVFEAFFDALADRELALLPMALEVFLAAPLPGYRRPVAQLGDEGCHAVVIAFEIVGLRVDVGIEAVHRPIIAVMAFATNVRYLDS